MSAERRCVLYLNHGAKPSGAEFALLRMLGALDRTQVRPIIIFGEDGPAADLAREIGVETHVIPMAVKIREVRKDTLNAGAFMHMGRLWSFVGYAIVIAQFAMTHGVDVIHTNTIKAHLYGALAGRIAGLPVIWHLRDYVNESYLPPAAVKVVRALARFAPRHIIAVSRSVLEQLHLGKNRQKASVVLDGLTERELEAECGTLASRDPNAGPHIGIVGRLAQWKGQHVFLEAAEKVVAAGIDAHFSIIGAALFGEEEYEMELRRQVEALGLNDRVQFRGFRRDVTGELRNLSILVHASTTGEPFGQVIVEGMAVGLPVVASCGGGVPEIITHGENGLLTKMGDSTELAEAIIFLVRQPEDAKRLGAAGYDHVHANFRVARGARQLEALYGRVVSGAARQPLEAQLQPNCEIR